MYFTECFYVEKNPATPPPLLSSLSDPKRNGGAKAEVAKSPPPPPGRTGPALPDRPPDAPRRKTIHGLGLVPPENLPKFDATDDEDNAS